MLTPESGGQTPENFTYPEKLADEIAGVVGDYEIDIEVDYDQDWRGTEIIERLSRNLAIKRKALHHLLETDGDVPILFGVLEAPDRLMHVHYKYIDPAHEHYNRPEASVIRERAWSFFDEMDEVIGDMLAWAGSDAFVITMSDHGFQGKDKGVNMNLALKEWGMLSLKGAGAVAQSQSLRKVGRKVKGVLPKSIRRRAKGAAHGSVDWANTKAFSAPIPQQGIYVNLEGREPNGVVPESQYEQVRDEIIERFSGLVDPDDGKPVLDHIYKREDVVHGPQAQWAPDLFPVCRHYSYELSDGLFSPGVLTDYRDLPRGFHHMDGVFGVAGPGVEPADDLTASLYDIAPTALHLAGCPLPDMDGKVLMDLLPEEHRGTSRTVSGTLPLAGEGVEAKPYSAEEEAQIEESLRNLGYL
jgi:predicted AlkP superfamily phosphohydrolase/phosphomutase